MLDWYCGQDMDKSNIQALYVVLEIPKELPMGIIFVQSSILGEWEKNCDIPTSQSASLGLSDVLICVCSADRFCLHRIHRTHTQSQWHYTANVYNTVMCEFEKQIPWEIYLVKLLSIYNGKQKKSFTSCDHKINTCILGKLCGSEDK